MPNDRYSENPALRPTILASALKPVQRQPQPAQREAAEDQGPHQAPRAA